MENAEFMQLIATLRGLDHHQRKRLSAALKQSSDEAKVLELIVRPALRAKAPVRTVPVSSCTAMVGLAGCNVIIANIATRPSMPSPAHRWRVFATSPNGWIIWLRWRSH